MDESVIDDRWDEIKYHNNIVVQNGVNWLDLERIEHQDSISKKLPSLDEVGKTLPEIGDLYYELKWTPHKDVKSTELAEMKLNFKAQKRDKLAILNKHPRDDNIVFFEEPHIYFVEGTCRDYMSVTTVLKAFFKPFHKEKVAQTVLVSKTFQMRHQPSNKYHGCENNVESIIKSWDNAAYLGTHTHKCLEQYITKEKTKEEILSGIHEECKYAFQYFIENMYEKRTSELNWLYIAYRVEWLVYDKESRIVGSIDYVGYNPETGKYILVDWKRCLTISSYGTINGKGCCSSYKDCNFNRYILQLNLYRIILLRNYGIEIEAMYLVHFKRIKESSKSSTKPVSIYKVPEETKCALQMLATRKKCLLGA